MLNINKEIYKNGHTIPNTYPGGCHNAFSYVSSNLFKSRKVNGVDTKNGEALTATSFINREFKYIYN